MKERLYYDGACPLCNFEVSHLRERADDELELVDVHSMDCDPDAKARLLRTLHLTLDSGELVTGLDANVAAWQHTRWGWLFRWLRWPVIGPVADRVYAFWADVRYERRYGRKPVSTVPE